MKFKLLPVAIVALTGLCGLTGLTGCSQDSGSNPTSAPANQAGTSAGAGLTVDPCTLITTAQATAALGEQAKDGVAHAYQSTQQCQWDSTNGSVAILVYVGGQKAKWSSTVDLAKKSPKYSDVSNLGDAAFSNGFDLHILKGDDMYQIGVAGPFQDTVDRAITVAKQALARV
jgi:hypothetical protein